MKSPRTTEKVVVIAWIPWRRKVLSGLVDGVIVPTVFGDFGNSGVVVT